MVFFEGYNMMDIVGTLTKIVQSTDKIKDETLRLFFLKAVTDFKMRALEGLDSHL